MKVNLLKFLSLALGFFSFVGTPTIFSLGISFLITIIAFALFIVTLKIRNKEEGVVDISFQEKMPLVVEGKKRKEREYTFFLQL